MRTVPKESGVSTSTLKDHSTTVEQSPNPRAVSYIALGIKPDLMTKTYRFHQLDVFTNTPLLGNALAVVHKADGLDDSAMQAFARWTNLSETTFLMQPQNPGADYRVRI